MHTFRLEGTEASCSMSVPWEILSARGDNFCVRVYFWEEALCPMARAKMEAKARNIDNTKTKEQLQEAMQHLSDLQQRLLSACSGGASAAEEGVEGECDEEANAPAPRYSGKVEALLSLLKYLSEEADDSEQPLRCMIFCERVATTYPLSYLINDFLGKQVSLPVSGVSAMTESVRNANLEAFNVGRVGMLVATSSLEEGIDIQKCNVVIRFDIFHNVKSHVQGAGRARDKNARIYYSRRLRRDAELMQEVARDPACPSLDPPVAAHHAGAQDQTARSRRRPRRVPRPPRAGRPAGARTIRAGSTSWRWARWGGRRRAARWSTSPLPRCPSSA
ncbi:unnamed protein product, partial [Prorocentrum cordatum]